MKTKPAAFIVVYDDDGGLCVPMGWDKECDGAICFVGNMAAIFATRAEALTAIRISAAFAKLRKTQGLPYNSDFVEGVKHIKTVPLMAKESLR